jgi:hypothetical protein
MHKLMLASLAIVTGCADHRAMAIEITGATARVAGSTSKLGVPASCPIYTPNGGDIDTPELPFRSPILFGCGVDGDSRTYGLVTGDIGDLAVLSGGTEIGVFFAFDSNLRSLPPTAAQLDLDGSAARVRAWSAPYNVHDAHSCCAESHDIGTPDHRIPIALVALGAGGMLLSLGQFDRSATQVAVELDGFFASDGPPVGWIERFYVNGEPPVIKR